MDDRLWDLDGPEPTHQLKGLMTAARLAFAMWLTVLAGCGDRGAPPAAGEPVFAVSIKGGAISAPDSAAPGWTRLRVDEDGAGHILVAFRLPDGLSDSAVTSLMLALDTVPATPAPALAMGGPEVGDTGEVIIELTPGRYLLGCVIRGEDGHRHLVTGESRLLTVSGFATAGRDSAPVMTQEVGMVDFAYVGPERWAAGTHMLRVDNRGQQEHQFRLARLAPGSTLQQWLESERETGTPVAGVSRMGPGGVAYLPVSLAPGTYVAHCLITDPASGRPHVLMGMVRAITVE
jgi:hypothetical protein